MIIRLSIYSIFLLKKIVICSTSEEKLEIVTRENAISNILPTNQMAGEW